MPANCSAEEAELDGLNQEMADLRDLLSNATSGEKPSIVRAMQRLRPKLIAAQAAYDACVSANPAPAPKNYKVANHYQLLEIDVKTSLGDTFWKTGSSPEIVLSMVGDGDAASVSVPTYNYPQIAIDGGLCTDTVTITQVGSGFGNRNGGALTFACIFKVEHNILLPNVFDPSDLQMVMSTSNEGGYEIDPVSGGFIMSGTGSLVGGFANGSRVKTRLTGRLDRI